MKVRVGLLPVSLLPVSLLPVSLLPAPSSPSPSSRSPSSWLPLGAGEPVQAVGITFMVIQVIKPELQGPDAVEREVKGLSLAWTQPADEVRRTWVQKAR